MFRRLLTFGLLTLLLLGQGLFSAHFLLHHHVISAHSGRVIHTDHCPDHEGGHGALPKGADEDLCQYFWVFALGSQLQLPAPPVVPQASQTDLPAPQITAQRAAPSVAVLALAPSHSPPSRP
jgi:hypothetical protein